ncbi:dUTP diphosphatase [Jaminaea rosea]|uniref:Deoxyuridine 5'-triphosphate nucleotidohydrolase n=1 Tax=Jaminaea rosea TaxID=1569628 RepID=A0A316UK70_9BASI|nr:dUTP diphosphatase [Jaminaea rosea]PWN25620.1 dUTP diphosphatase [Jaminaea rosea]
MADSTTASSSTPVYSPTAFLVQCDPEHPNAKLPTRGSALAAGYDLYASETVTLPKEGGRKVVQTGIRMKLPEGCYGRVAPRSGLAVKHGIDVGAGVIDADYRGLLGILLFNFGQEDFTINTGDRIAQLVIERIHTPEVTAVDSLDVTVRGEGGFGSSGGFGPKA